MGVLSGMTSSMRSLYSLQMSSSGARAGTEDLQLELPELLV